MGLGWTELLIVVLIVLLLFGASRLPRLARSLGESLQEFRRALKKEDDSDSLPEDSPDEPSP